ncbi:unnamed protein product [Prorocentrum cordatum]|uniref:Uncharacterized protein n=1 Tax=Prorocentrum cordatum TaxID=2364126 RepID=A0ABN9PF87_9DINO|nr:unnamed protein product [Polarella glacialis]
MKPQNILERHLRRRRRRRKRRREEEEGGRKEEGNVKAALKDAREVGAESTRSPRRPRRALQKPARARRRRARPRAWARGSAAGGPNRGARGAREHLGRVGELRRKIKQHTKHRGSLHLERSAVSGMAAPWACYDPPITRRPSSFEWTDSGSPAALRAALRRQGPPPVDAARAHRRMEEQEACREPPRSSQALGASLDPAVLQAGPRAQPRRVPVGWARPQLRTAAGEGAGGGAGRGEDSSYRRGVDLRNPK